MKKKTSSGKKHLEVLYQVLYIVVILAIIAALYSFGQNQGSLSILGYSFATVETRSMQSEIPQGSLICVSQVRAEEIAIDDDITYMVSDKTTITHRVIEITEATTEMPMRIFTTQGVDNPDPDRDPVYAINVVGKVVWSVPGVGFVLGFVKENIILVLVIIAIIMALCAVLKRLFRKDTPNDPDVAHSA